MEIKYKLTCGRNGKMKWVTREKVHVDRVACPWLIRNFIDKEAEFIFVPKDTDPSSISSGIPFDMKGVELGHHGAECTFDALVKKYGLGSDQALVRMQEIVRLADTGRLHESPLSFALEALATGYGLTSASDAETLEKEFHLYDALYAYLRQDS